ncbi:hypothetical protein LCGC14_0387840 [marine sediment metagenome]|uniref:Uncharacterized protein n=1 Tax=marine sediment metagenome TaxID=412755 RepID=A0A0F9TIK0_9ZZZZ
MEIDITEQEAKLKAEAQKIGEELAQLQQRHQVLINEALKNQGALDLLQKLGELPKGD